MKQRKRLTRKMKELLTSKNLNPQDWHLERNTSEKIVFVHRHSDKTTKTIFKKDGEVDGKL